jgi:hypothetical protein
MNLLQDKSSFSRVDVAIRGIRLISTFKIGKKLRQTASALHCTALHCTVYQTAGTLHCTALHCTALHSKRPAYCTALHCTALYRKRPAHCTALHCTAIGRHTTLHCTALYNNIQTDSRHMFIYHSTKVKLNGYCTVVYTSNKDKFGICKF